MMKNNKVILFSFWTAKIVLSALLCIYLYRGESKPQSPISIVSYFSLSYLMFTVGGYFLSRAWKEKFMGSLNVFLMFMIPMLVVAILGTILMETSDNFQHINSAIFIILLGLVILFILYNIYNTLRKIMKKTGVETQAQ